MFSKKYICLLLIFIVGLMAVSQVSAAEDNINDTVGMDENEEIILEKNTSHDVLAAENGNDLLSANPTFKDLNDVINGNDDSVINLAQDYKFDSNIDTDFKKGIVIDRDLTINGNGHMIDADGRARIFNVTDTHVVLFNNISFVKGSGQGNAGAVIGGTSINCNFTDCAAISGEGGAAIYKGTAVNCTFTRNLVLIGQGGAAMYMGYAINCTFIENNAPFGGAMYGGTAVNCTFKGNKARNGGAIYETSARNCIFISNAASSGSGGAASNSDCYNCYFEHNSANAGGAGYGGNYYVCIFESNQVIDGTSGGALYEPHFAFNCTFRNNAAEEGSGIYGGAAAYCIFSNNSRVGTVYQLNPDIVADDFDSIYGAGDVFDFKVMASNVEIYDLKVTLTLYRLMEDGSEEYVNDVHLLSGQGWIIDLDRGSYKIKLTLDDFEYSAVARVSLNVIKVPTTISLNATHIITNPVDTTYLIATLKDYKNNTLSGFGIFVDYNDKTYTTDANGQATVPIGDLPLGMHTILFKFDGDGDYNGTSAAVTAEVYKLPTEITSPEKSYGFSYNWTENTVNVTLMDNLGRPVSGVKLTVYLNGTTENYTTDENGTIRIPVSAFLPGNYSLNVTFEGDDNYIKSNNTYSFEVFKVETALSGNFIREYNAPGNLIVSLEYMDYNKHVFVPLVHTEVFVEFNGNNFTYVTVGGGTIGIPTGGLAVGNYTAKIIFKGNEFYENATLITNVTINKGISQFIFTRPYFYPHYGNGEEFKVQLQDSYGNPVVGNQTITVELNGLRNYYTDEDGAAFISSNDAPIGYHRARITFVGNENYTNATRFLDVTVDKGNTQLSLDYQAVAFDSGEDLVFTLKDGMGRPINGVNLTVEFNGIKEYTTDENGKIYVPTDGLAVGSYAANITFEGNGNYVKATNLNVNFNISKATANIVVNPVSLIYSEQGWLNITLSYNNRPIKGNLLNISLNSRFYGYIFDRNYTTDENGTVRILLEDLPAEEYFVTIIYGGNENFTEITRYTFIRVEKGFSVLSAGNLVTNYNADEKFIFMLRDGFGRPVGGSNVTVYLNGVVKMFTTDENGQIYVSNNGLAAGSYAANITFEGNVNYTKARKLSVNVTINKVTPHIIFENSDINTVYGVEYLINITFKDDHHVPIRGYNVLSVEFKSPSKSYSAKEYITDENGKLTISTKDLAAEYYLMDVTFQGNENFTEETNYKRVIIKKDDTKLYSDNLITSYNSGEKLLVNLTDSFGKSIEGVSITVILYGAAKYTTDENGTIEVSTDDLNPGDYLTLISFDGNENYTQSNLIASISIIKDNTTLDISKEIVDNDVNITAYVHPNATGLVKFEIKGPEQYIIYSDIVEGKAFSHHILTEGDYVVNATYMGDIHFNSNSTSQNFTVKGHIKKNTTIVSKVNVENYTVTITSTVDPDAGGFVTVGILGQTFIVPVSGGEAVFTYDFAPGTYVADVAYLGDDNFNNASTTVTFTVTEQVVELKNTTVSVDVEAVENDVTITASVDSLASGLVEFNIDGKAVYIVVNNGKAVYDTSLPAGDYIVVVTYIGDSRFNANRTSKEFTVTDHIKKNTTLISDVVIYEYRVSVSVDVDPAATGFVEFTLNGNSIFVKIADGKAVMDTILLPGDYTVKATYLGDDDFNANATDITFTVEEIQLKNTTLDVKVDVYENNVTITVNIDYNATGLVKFDVIGAENYSLYLDVKNGVAVLEDVLENGDYKVDITYMGDLIFNSNATSVLFTVVGHVKNDTAISSVAVVDNYTVTITTDVDSSASGFVTVGILGQTFIVPVSDGKAVFTYDFAPGTYVADVAYLGDNNFNNASTTVTFTVTEQVVELKNTTVSVDVEAVENDVTITAGVDSLASGLVEFNIGGNVVYIAVNNGKAVYRTDLPAGEYNVVVTYMGDSRFNANRTSKEFTVTDHIKKNTTLISDVVIYEYRASISVDVDSAATGFVEFTLNGNSIFVKIADGKAVMDTILLPGEYTVKATYLGDDDFNANTTDISFTVNEIQLKNTTIDARVDVNENNVTVTVTVDSNATGLVKFEVTGDEKYSIYVEVENGVAVLEEILNNGDYKVDITYMGGLIFNANTTSVLFTVVGHVKNDTAISSVAAVDNYTVTITTNVDSAATGFVTVGILGQTFIVPVSDGKAVFTYDFAPGTYVADVAYLGDDNFNNASTTVSFTVTEQVVELKNTTVSVEVISVENDVTITAGVDTLASGLVEFDIGGNVVYIAVNNGKAVYSTNLPAGMYNLIVTYMGDSKFNANRTSKEFTVTDHIKKNTTIGYDVVIYEYRVSISVDVDSAATGFVEFTLNGNSIFVKIADGKAVMDTILLPSDYTIKATYLGDDDFNANTTDITFTVEEIQLKNTTIDSNVVVYENNVTVTVNVDSNATGLVKFEVTGDEKYSVYVEVEDGVAVLEEILDKGDYMVNITYMGDLIFNANTTSVLFTVVGHVKNDTAISSAAAVDNYTVTITTNVDSAATGFVTVGILGQTFIVPVSDGKAVFTYDFAPGTYVADVAYLGDDNFNNASTTVSFTVTEQVVELKNTAVSVDVTAVENDVTITAGVDTLASGLVEFNIDGKAVYIAVNNGKAVYSTNLPAGVYNVIVTYMGDSRFNANRTSKEFTVTDHIKKNTTMISEVTVDGYEVVVSVGVDPAATGFVEFRLNGNSIFALVTDGKAVMDTMLAPGEYTVKATYLGDDDFNANATDITFTVEEIPLKNTTIDVNVEVYENNVTITANVDSAATGFVRFDVAGAENYIAYMEVKDGVAILETLLTVGDYTITATYLGDGKFNINSTTDSFTVAGHIKKDTRIDAVANVDNNTVTIVTTLDSNATGFVTLGILGQTFIVPVSDGKAVFTYDFNPGSYTANVTYLGDDDFNGATTTVSFTVIKKSVVLKNTTVDVVVGAMENDVSITAKVNESASGLVEFVIDGRAVYIAVNNGEAVYEVVLPGGDYNVTVTYLGDDRFNPNSTVESFVVSDHVKLDIAIGCSVVVNGSEVTLTAFVNESDAGGFVEFNIAGRKYYAPVENGAAVLVSDFLAGTHMGNVRYLGDEKYDSAVTLVYIHVAGQNFTDTAIDVDVEIWENNVTITASVDSVATGFVRFDVTGAENYTLYVVVDEGKAVLEYVLTAGDYTVTATYLGDDKFAMNSTSESFSVVGHVKKDTEISAIPSVEGSTVTIETSVDSDATGHVAISVLGQTFIVPVSDGKATFAYDFTPGIYSADVVYLGDDNFNGAGTTVSFTVIKQVVELKNTTISVDVDAVENNVTITVAVDSLASGLVEFNIDGQAVYIAVNNGKAVYEVFLPVGDYNVTVTYMGDDKFNSNSTTKSFAVVGHVKKDTEITAIPSVDGSTVTIETSVDSDATGYVAISVLGQTFIVPVSGGKAVFTYDFAPGTYVADVAYLGDNNFNNASATVSFTVTEQVVELKNTTVSVDVTSVENDVTITAGVDTLASGLVEFNINGKAVYIAVNNGKAVYSTNLPAGVYNVIVTYMGDSRFNANRTSKEFTVKDHIKKNTTIGYDVVIYEYRVSISVDVDSAATGFVEFTLNGNSIFVKIADGKAVMDTILLPSDYTVKATYLGDDDFNANATDITFTVEEIPLKNTTIDVNVEVYENNVTITANVDSAATGFVRFDVAGAENYIAYMEVKDGVAILETLLSVGDYTITATYLGDGKFNINSTTDSFTVAGHIKKDTKITALPSVEGSTVTIETSVDENATGYVAIGVLGQTFIVPINGGKAVFTYDFVPGTYNVNIVYVGDDNFNNASTTASFTVIKQKVELKNTTLDVIVGAMENDVTVIAKVNESASGLVEFVIGGQAVYIAVNNGEAAYEVVLPGGDYSVTVTYLGDDRFNPNSTVKSFVVSDHVKLDIAIGCSVVVNGSEVTLTAFVNESDAGGFVEFNIAGRKYYAPVENGTAVLVSDFLAGTYIGNVRYLGDEKYDSAVTLVYIHVAEQNFTDTAIDVDVWIWENNVTITASVDSAATGFVRFDVAGAENYTLYVLVENGVAVLEDVLAAGDYTVTAAYLGDAKFNANMTSKSFIISGHVKKGTEIQCEVMVDYNNVALTVLVNPNATGLVIFEMGNYNISVALKDGKSVLNNVFQPGKYNITVTYLGDDDFNINSTQIAFAVNRFATEITSSAVTVVYGTSKKLALTLTDVKGNLLIGKSVSIKLNGKTYQVTTNGKGQATFTVPKLVPKKYAATITFADDSIYLGSSASVKVTVKKATPKITAKAKKFKRKVKTKKYKITLKNNLNKVMKKAKVTLKVKGKTYKAKTNSKGKATFKIKNLTKKGKYKAKVTFKGNKYYKKVTKKVIIKVK